MKNYNISYSTHTQVALNYRQVLVTSVSSKMLEKILKKRMDKFLGVTEHPALPDVNFSPLRIWQHHGHL